MRGATGVMQILRRKQTNSTLSLSYCSRPVVLKHNLLGICSSWDSRVIENRRDYIMCVCLPATWQTKYRPAATNTTVEQEILIELIQLQTNI